jgi:hypothetical protein
MTPAEKKLIVVLINTVGYILEMMAYGSTREDIEELHRTFVDKLAEAMEAIKREGMME